MSPIKTEISSGPGGEKACMLVSSVRIPMNFQKFYDEMLRSPWDVHHSRHEMLDFGAFVTNTTNKFEDLFTQKNPRREP